MQPAARIGTFPLVPSVCCTSRSTLPSKGHGEKKKKVPQLQGAHWATGP